MIEPDASSMSRRELIKAATAVSVALLASPFLQACTTKDAEVFFSQLGDLAHLINNYRSAEGLSKIPLSSSLTIVALKHVIDLNTYHYDKTCGGNSNDPNDWDLHAWSNNGNWKGVNGEGAWKGCCYDPVSGPINGSCMWEKPKEIAGYPANGFEIAHWEPGAVTAQSTLDSWKTSESHNAVILNEAWKGIGAVYAGNYACAWFGEKAD